MFCFYAKLKSNLSKKAKKLLSYSIYTLSLRIIKYQIIKLINSAIKIVYSKFVCHYL